MNIYRSYLEKIQTYEQSDYAHKINFILGAYYLAYKAIDDVLMDIINPNNNSLKDFLFEKAKDAYEYIGPKSCKLAANAPGGGPKGCQKGCMGYGI